MTTLTFTIPPNLWLTANRHTVNRGHRKAQVDGLHALAILTARQARVEPITGPVAAHWTIRYPKGVRRDKGDATNAQPTTKACLDALVKIGILEDDGPLHVVAETFQRGPNLAVARMHEVRLVLTPQAVPW